MLCECVRVTFISVMMVVQEGETRRVESVEVGLARNVVTCATLRSLRSSLLLRIEKFKNVYYEYYDVSMALIA